MTAWTETRTGITLAVRVTPKASRTEITGTTILPDGRHALAMRLAAPPVDGAANAALIAWLGKALGLRKSAIAITSGETSRIKLLALDGEPAAIIKRLEQMLED